MSDRSRRRERRRLFGQAGQPTTARKKMAAVAPDLADGAEGRVDVGAGAELWYRVGGSGPGTIIVPTTGNDLDFGGLRVPGHRVLFYDVRSRGRSDLVTDPNHLGFAAEVADLEAVRHHFGIERFSALAWSYHAGVVANYALQHPERIDRVVMAAPIPLRADGQPLPARQPAPHLLAQLDQLDAGGQRDTDPEAFCRAWREVYVPLLLGHPAAFEGLAPVCGYPNEWPWHVARSLVFVFAELRTYDWRDPLRELDAPTLVIHGSLDHDPVDLAREWADVLPGGRLLEMDGIGQCPWVERPDEFFGLVNRFFAGHPT